MKLSYVGPSLDLIIETGEDIVHAISNDGLTCVRQFGLYLLRA